MKGNWPRAIVVCAMLALACSRGHAEAASAVTPPLPDRELIVATREVPPFAMKNKDGSWRGISIELWQRVAERLHLRYRFSEQASNQEILNGVASGAFDAGVATLSVTAARQRIVDFSVPYYTAGLGVAIQTGEPRWLAIYRTLFSIGFLQAVVILLALGLGVGFGIWIVERVHYVQLSGG